jgi:hypothetical protein
MNKIDFMFVDGFHEKHFVIEEIEALFPKLSDNAVVYFHDTNGSNESCDVPGALKEKGIEVEFIKTLNGMAKYVKKTVRGMIPNGPLGNQAFSKLFVYEDANHKHEAQKPQVLEIK